jgi:hypothetical protein
LGKSLVLRRREFEEWNVPTEMFQRLLDPLPDAQAQRKRKSSDRIEKLSNITLYSNYKLSKCTCLGLAYVHVPALMTLDTAPDLRIPIPTPERAIRGAEGESCERHRDE